MDFLWDAITGWLKDILVSGIMSNLSGMFDSVNDKAVFSIWCRTSRRT